MVLYAVYHGGSLPLAILHRLLRHRDEKAVLLVGNTRWHIGSKFDISQMSYIFDDVVTYDASLGEYLNKPASELSDLIISKYSQYFKDMDFSKFSKIYNLIDGEDSFGYYLSYLNIKYTHIEHAPNLVKMRYTEWQSIPNSKENYQYTVMLKSRNVYNFLTNPLIDVIYYKDFNVVEQIQFLSSVEKEKILKAYGMKEILNVEVKSIFLPPSSYATWESFSKRSEVRDAFLTKQSAYAFANSIFLDFVVGIERIIIKPHPRDSEPIPFPNNENWIPGYFPSEFLGFIKDLQLNQVYAIGSSSFGALMQQYNIEESVFYPYNYFYYMHIALKVHLALQLAVIISPEDVSYYGITETLLNIASHNLDISKKCRHIETVSNENKFTLIFQDMNRGKNILSRDSILGKGDNDVIVFVAKSDFLYIFKDQLELFSFIIPIDILKLKGKDSYTGNLETETIYIFTKSTDLRQKIMDFSFSKTLKYTGIELYVNPTTEEEVAQHIANLKQEILTQQVQAVQEETTKQIALLSETQIKEISLLSETQTKQLAEADKSTQEKFNALLHQQAEQNKVINLSSKNTETLAKELVQLKNSIIHLESQLIEQQRSEAERAEYLEIHKDTLYAKYYEKIERKYPKGTKKREFWKKIAEKFL